MLPERNISHNRTAKIQLSNVKYELAQFISILTHTQLEPVSTEGWDDRAVF
jgi:hypothetical protein